MSFDIEQLYKLLPAYHRERDTKLGNELLTYYQKSVLQQLTENYNNLSDKESAEALRLKKLIDETERGPLKAILSLFAEQIAMLEDNLEQLYDDQFIETCAEWIVPYIGDLTGTRGLLDFPNMTFSQRAQVANTIAYRRRKGTAAVIEQLACDVTGWVANVVEYFQLIATTQYLNHLRLNNLVTLNLRDNDSLEKLHSPFDNVSRNVDVRNIQNKRGKYNIPNLGIFLWRNTSFSYTQSPACKMDDRRYMFDIIGYEVPLYNNPVTEEKITDLAKPENVPHRISRYLLYKYFDKYYGKGKSILLYKDGNEIIPDSNTTLSDLFTVCDLSDKKDINDVIIGWNNMPQHKIAIDPELGRIAFPASATPPTEVKTTYYRGALAEIGGGEYGRSDTFQVNTGKIVKVPNNEITVQAAVNALVAEGGIVEVQNNECYNENLVIDIPAGKKIELRAADKKRPVLFLNGSSIVSGGENAEFSINGFLVAGGNFRVPEKNNLNIDNKLNKFTIQHATIRSEKEHNVLSPPLQSGQPVIIVECSDTSLVISNSVLCSIRCIDTANIKINDSIIDAASSVNEAISGIENQKPSAILEIKNSTIIGKVHTLMMKMVSNTIIMADLTNFDSWEYPVWTDRIQKGCIRFSYVSTGSKIPKPYHCVPSGSDEDSNIKPVFKSLQFGSSGYCQLSSKCSSKIMEGADDSSEMGVFHDIYQSQRIKNLNARLEEYLRFGLEAGIFLV